MTDLRQAIALHQSGQLIEAEQAYRALIQADPEQADALALLGLVLGTQGRHEEAIGFASRAVAKDSSAALLHFHQGSVLMNAQRLPDAIAAFRRAIVLQPGFAPAHYNLGNALRAAGDWTGAITAYGDTIRLDPNAHEAYNNLALSLVHEKQLQPALEQAIKSVTVMPGYGEGWRTVCNIAEQLKDYQLALTAGEACTRLMPDSHFAWFGYGVALNRLDRHGEAVEAYKQALALKPDRADIWDNLGQTYQSMNRLEEAEATFRKTVEVAGQAITDEDSREVDEAEYGHRHWHLALMELLRGKLPQGFKRYRSRFKEIADLKRPDYLAPLWRGEDLKGKTLIAYGEQGFGDTLMLCRYLPLIKAQGGRIAFFVRKPLGTLFAGWHGIDQLYVDTSPPAGYDYYASVFDLPHRMGTTLETIPANIPYLPQLAPTEATALENDGRPRIGVVWGGSALHGNDAKRSIPLPVFAKLFGQQDLHFFSLNRDAKAGDRDLLPRFDVTDLTPRIQDFADAARFISQLDLVITCDTATAHLAGGLGVKTWTVLPVAPDWRWLTGRSDSPWYPAMRLFRQGKAGDWHGVIDEVGEALRRREWAA